ncbi:MAG: cyclic nucleotide-binding domain-containing protein, partial [Desulfatitalea sp.]|nr:cyclic nucleotide-binding domain-containing protein [Desulfatitalea sp.]NNK02119.1 cyclic nucleotide-binding domain-containing protein [Desulfatitalea sp.]
TPWLADRLRFDNLLVVYLAISLAGTLVVWLMTRRFPILRIEHTAGSQEAHPEKHRSMIREVGDIWPILKSSLLLRLMIVITFLPNVLIPILNYQFNYAVDSHFASETGMVTFFSYFRGALNIVSLIILLFVGKIYGRWGLPVALMFHPFNYILAFVVFLLRFDILSAMYARMSTNIIRTTINMPANAVLMGLFPESFRAMVRPFLRGTVVRIALFTGSSLIILSNYLFHPRYLSLVALPFALAWVITPFILRRHYADILLGLIAHNQLDLKAMDAQDVAHLFRDRKSQDQLISAFKTAKVRDVGWYVSLLARCKVPDLAQVIMDRLGGLPIDQQVALLGYLPTDVGGQTVLKLQRLADGTDSRLTLACLQAANRMHPSVSVGFDWKTYLNHADPNIRAHAAAGMMAQTPDTMRRAIVQWLESDDPQTEKAGIIAAGLSHDTVFKPLLIKKLNAPQAAEVRAETIRAAHGLGVYRLNDILAMYLGYTDQQVRSAALRAYRVIDKDSLKRVIPLLADDDLKIQKIASQRIAQAPFVDGKTLIKALNTPNKIMRRQLFELLDRLQIRDVDLFHYARNQIAGAYKCLAEREGILLLPPLHARDLLADHLKQQCRDLIGKVLRVLAIQDRSRHRMRVIVRGLLSADGRQRANGIEALSSVVDHRLFKLLNPLLGDTSGEQVRAVGRKEFKIPDYRTNAAFLIAHLLQRFDLLTVMLVLHMLTESKSLPVTPSQLSPMIHHDNWHVKTLARRALNYQSLATDRQESFMKNDLSLPGIILRLKAIDIFEHLSVEALAAVASETEMVYFEPDTIVIREGDPGETLYLIVDGEVAVIKTHAPDQVIELDRIGAGDYFGEMALFEDIPRTATIKTLEASRMLVLHKHEFKEMVREYPQIALEICKALSGRIRKLHEKIPQARPEGGPTHDANSNDGVQ